MIEHRKLLLIGMMGAGKTTTGRLLADRLEWSYVDTDDEIERQLGQTVPEIWKAGGETAFRQEESRVLADICAKPGPAVVSVAGGAVLASANRDCIRDGGFTVWLRADAGTLAARVGSGAGRPLLSEGPATALARLSQERAPIYAELADLVFDVDRMSPPQVVDRIVDALKEQATPR